MLVLRRRRSLDKGTYHDSPRSQWCKLQLIFYFREKRCRRKRGTYADFMSLIQPNLLSNGQKFGIDVSCTCFSFQTEQSCVHSAFVLVDNSNKLRIESSSD